MTGEPLGMDYLYGQTGVPLFNVQDEIESLETMEEEEEGEEDEADEGFLESEETLADPTITMPLPKELVIPSPSSSHFSILPVFDVNVEHPPGITWPPPPADFYTSHLPPTPDMPQQVANSSQVRSAFFPLTPCHFCCCKH